MAIISGFWKVKKKKEKSLPEISFLGKSWELIGKWIETLTLNSQNWWN